MALTRATGKQITVKNEGTGSVVRNLQDKLNETVSVKDFGAVGDGVTDDTAAIQAAIGTGNKTVYLPTGTYFIGGATITLPNNLKIIGDGESSKITCDASTRTDPYNDHLFVAGTNNIFRDFLIDGDRQGAVQEIRSIYLNGVSNVVVENIIFKDHGIGIWAANSNYTNIFGCDFPSGMSKCHIVSAGQSSSEYAQNLIIQNNFFGTTAEEAIDIQGYTRSVIIDSNTFFGNHWAYDVDGTEVIDIGGAANYDIVISDNRVNNDLTADAFVWVKLETQNVTISGNTIKNLKTSGGQAAFRVSNASHVNITGNTVQNATRLVVTHTRGGATEPVKNLTISGNSATGITAEGIFFESSSPTDVTIDGNSIIDNESPSRGMYIAFGNNIVISNNVIAGFGNDGISLVGGGAVSNVIIDSNIVYDCSDALSVSAAGTIITGNNCSSSNDMGLRLSSAHNSVVTGNIFNNNTTIGITLVGTNSSSITGNVCTGNSTGLWVASNSSDVVLVGNMLLNNTSANLSGTTKLIGSSVNANNIV